MGLPEWLSGKKSTCNDTGSIPESERFPEEGTSNPLQYSCLGNPMDIVACWAAIHGVEKELDMT